MFAAAGVTSGGLEVAVGGRADPDASPSGRYDEGADAGEGLAVADELAFGVVIAEVFAVPLAANAGPEIGNVTEACGAG